MEGFREEASRKAGRETGPRAQEGHGRAQEGHCEAEEECSNALPSANFEHGEPICCSLWYYGVIRRSVSGHLRLGAHTTTQG